MKQRPLKKQYTLLNCLSSLPRKILLLYGQENVTEFVLHELCQEYCFGLKKAAYFVDNPDFNCLKGVAGFCEEEAYANGDIWQNPKAFSVHMKAASFNKKVQLFMQESFKKKGESEEEVIKTIAYNLGIEKPKLHIWDVKHNNHGYFVYEEAVKNNDIEEHLVNGLCLLSLCPLY
ncbi:MAG: hypothetical protein WCD44_02445 [Candidatus Babeliales bacterium]